MIPFPSGSNGCPQERNPPRKPSAPDEPQGPDPKSDARRRTHNRAAFMVWLTHYNNRFGSSGKEGMINLQALPKPGPEFGPLNNAANVERLEGAKGAYYGSDMACQAIIERMRKEAWYLYMALRFPYLDPDASPAIVEKWRAGAQAGIPGDKMQYGLHQEAIKWALARITEEGFVIINPPSLTVAKGDKDAERQKRRQRAKLKFFTYEAEMGTGAAVRRVCAEEGYGRNEVYKIIREREGEEPI